MSLGSGEPVARTPPETRYRTLALIVAACCLIGAGPPGAGRPAELPGVSSPEAATEPDPLSTCERAGAAMEQASGLPPGLLRAIGRVESGRWDSARGRITPWPWTINAAGKGLWFASKDAAAQTVRDLLNGGTRSIDVGCFQISLLWHPMAFANLEQAFDPEANAAYAARFLLGLFSQTGSWEAAVEAYHSADPALGFAYRQQVFSTWASAAPFPALASGRSIPTLAMASRPIAMPQVIAGVQIWTPMPIGTAAGVVAMPGSPAAEASLAPPPGDTAPLPVVSYRVMPAGLLPARASRSQIRPVSAVGARR